MVVGSDPLLGWDDIVRFATIAAGTATIILYMTKTQYMLRDLIYKKTEELKTHFSDKLEYHERHDDTRFDNVRKDIISLRLQQAAKTGKVNGDSIRN